MNIFIYKKPHNRLGSGSEDANSVKQHSFFADINW